MNARHFRPLTPGIRIKLDEGEMQQALAQYAAKKRGVDPPFKTSEVVIDLERRNANVTLFEVE